MRHQGPGHTLQPTALVGELWAKIASMENVPEWPSRTHFFKWVSVAMSNLLCDYARRKNSLKAGGNRIRISLEGSGIDPAADSNDAVLDLLNDIETLCAVDADLGSVVRLRAVVGLQYAEIADVLQITESQVDRRLRAGRAWLQSKRRE